MKTKIVNQRKLIGLNQSELAFQAGCSLATIQNIEAGVANPSIETLTVIYEALGLEMETQTTAPNWRRLCDYGWPMEEFSAGETKAENLNQFEFLKLLSLAVNEVKDLYDSNNRRALRALLFAIGEEYPKFFKKRFAKNVNIQNLLYKPMTPRELRLSEAARERLRLFL